jgi:hypothetical protein
VNVSERIEAIRARLHASTNAPLWRAEPWPHILDPVGQRASVSEAGITACPPANAEFIAHAGADLLWLIDRLDAAHARAGALEARLERAVVQIGELRRAARVLAPGQAGNGRTASCE